MNSSINYDKGTNYPSNPDSGLGLEGDDDFSPSAGYDELNGDPGNDELNGGPGSDDLYDNAGDNLLNAGDNLLNGGPGSDDLYGGPDVDTFVDDGQPRHSLAGNDNIKLEGVLAFGDLNMPEGYSSLTEFTATTGEELAIVSGFNAADINDVSPFIE